MIKKISYSIAGIVLLLAVCFAAGPAAVKAAQTDGFQVNGTKLYDANGNEFVMRGVNYPHAWYGSESEQAIPAIAGKGFNCVRIVAANGQQWSQTGRSELEKLISLCKDNQLVAILEVHDATGKDDAYSLDQAVNYWIDKKSVLQGNEAYVIVNIANEWYGTWDDGSAWKNGYVSAVKKLRNAGIRNTLMVDCAGWGQYPQVIFDYGSEVLAADSMKNTMFSIHMYEYAGGNASTVKNNIDQVLNKNLCLAIGEFGGRHTNGDVDEATILSYCREKQVGWLAWSWKGNNGDLSYLDLAYDWAGNNLTEFGDRVINGADGIRETSKKCTVFTGDSGEGGGSEGGGSEGGGGDVSGKVNLFYGSAQTSGWGQAVSVLTVKNGGKLDLSSFADGDYFWVEYSGSEGRLELIFQSWSGGGGWVKISPTETGWTDRGTCYAKFYYADIVRAYGQNFSTLDQIHVGAMDEQITVKSVDLDF